ncbi:hypothetical protein AWJ20_2123 [Sugiyamaella lignohabitans]|uniref:RING-type domain-containing protein n=1 Tax=Sugiyamaella lignohabitans TaxID=796027 RepID=A0A167EVY7_9ASCO|nr:uncharacterized protein AWJ20_2123 [Sugiyamaella lignohabitans]ANB14528.1 hypothetical protein AWJ20_2123 [Sugiyamaella lignohabitans]
MPSTLVPCRSATVAADPMTPDRPISRAQAAFFDLKLEAVNMFAIIVLYPVAVIAAPFHLFYLQSVEWKDRRQNKKLLRSLPITVYNSHPDPVNNSLNLSWGCSENCNICLDDYVDGKSKLMTLPCGHQFHSTCAVRWIAQQMIAEKKNPAITCPVCKCDIR